LAATGHDASTTTSFCLNNVRHQGRLIVWKENKGFGFISPDAGGEQVFVHIRAFPNRSPRPVEDAILAYDLGVDPSGRVRAENVAIVGNEPASRFSIGAGTLLSGIAGLFLVLLGLLTYAGKLPNLLLQGYLAASAITFIAYAFDKAAAKSGRWRTRESTLQLLALACGWPGALLAQRALRHKSRKLSFQIVFWLTVILNCGVLWCLFTSSGKETVQQFLKTL
jgi:uncharacterized membrane protein YsdA (DUF1294 family)/cold shock CspA family protein